MSRLTTNKPVDEMSMLELVYNSCYVGEDGSAMYEDFETVRNARDFVRNLYKVHLNEEMPADDDVFDESMIDELQYEPEVHLNGLIALFYRNLWAMADMRERLKAYEDKEEQGLLIELPCKVGDTVYFTDRKYDRENRTFIPFVHHGYVKAIKFSARPTKITIEYEDLDDRCGRCKGHDIHASTIGKSVFLTRSEAEEALAKMGGK